MEELNYKVQYQIEIKDDELKPLDFYISSIKDSSYHVIDYLESIT
jgi:hypothetical protein